MNTRIILSTLTPALIIAIILVSCSERKKEWESKGDKPITVQVETPTKQWSESVSFSGQIESQETAFISTRVMGHISGIKVKIGDRVQKGQLLVTINNADILAKRAQAQSMISEVELAVKDAQKDYERYEALYQQQSASAKEFENVSLRYHSAKARAEAALQMKNEADAMLSYTNLMAPFSGIITQKHFDEGSLANPGMPILTMERPETYQVKAFFSEDAVGKIKSGMKAQVTIKATGKTFAGKIAEVSPSSQFTGGQYLVKVTVPASEVTGLFSGMYASVAMSIHNHSENLSLVVPASAIIHRDQLSGLYTVSEGQTAQLRWLKVGKQYNGQVEILSGLSPGEKFIAQSEGRLYSGVSVLVK